MSVICVEPRHVLQKPPFERDGPSQLRRMNMNTQEIGLLSNEELDAVVGGMMNNGQGQNDPKAPGALPAPGTNGAPGNGPNWGRVAAEGVIIGGLVIGLFNI